MIVLLYFSSVILKTYTEIFDQLYNSSFQYGLHWVEKRDKEVKMEILLRNLAAKEKSRFVSGEEFRLKRVF